MNMEEMEMFLSLSPESQLAFLAELQEILNTQLLEHGPLHLAANTACLPFASA